jgi:DNA-binding CsgD family transcriptional regulator
MMLVEDFFQTTTQADSREELIESFRRAVASMDYDRIHYFSFPNPMTRGPSEDVVVFSMLPQEWLEHYDAEHYEEIDPLGDHAVHTRTPFDWDSVVGAMELSRRQKRLIGDIRDAAMWDGFTVPIHGPFGQVNGVCFIRDRPRGLKPGDMHVGRVLAVQFHQAYTALEDADDGLDSALTPRERDVLLRLAEGCSNTDTAERLCISEHSVKFHVQNVCKKLGVNSRVAAVVKAIRLGMIVP